MKPAPPGSPPEQRPPDDVSPGDVHIPTGRRYCLITPCRNEAEFVRRTLESVAAQTLPPARWVIVDDGSSDATPEILAEWTRRLPYLQVLSKPDRGTRSVGPGVVETFYYALGHVDLDDYDFVCKFDADLELGPRYFERLVEIMEADPCLGNLSGKLHIRLPDGRLVPERTGDENAVGPSKFYRVACFRDIGGFVREVSWDGIDGHICRMRGWIAQSRDEEELRIVHLRQMGSSQQSLWEGRLRWGRGKYFMGSAWYYVLAVAVYRCFERPWLLSGVGIFWGYLRALASRVPRYENRDYRRFLRRYELRSMLFGKTRTTQRYNRAVRAGRQR